MEMIIWLDLLVMFSRHSHISILMRRVKWMSGIASALQVQYVHCSSNDLVIAWTLNIHVLCSSNNLVIAWTLNIHFYGTELLKLWLYGMVAFLKNFRLSEDKRVINIFEHIALDLVCFVSLHAPCQFMNQ